MNRVDRRRPRGNPPNGQHRPGSHSSAPDPARNRVGGTHRTSPIAAWASTRATHRRVSRHRTVGDNGENLSRSTKTRKSIPTPSELRNRQSGAADSEHGHQGLHTQPPSSRKLHETSAETITISINEKQIQMIEESVRWVKRSNVRGISGSGIPSNEDARRGHRRAHPETTN